MTGRKGPRGTLAMDPHALARRTNRVLLELGDVVGHVINQIHAQLLPGTVEYGFEALAGLPHQKLAIAPGEVCCSAHRAEIVLALLAADRGADELLVGQVNAIFCRRAAQRSQRIVADLITQAARAAVDHHADHVLFQSHHLGRFFVEHLIDNLHLQKMIARAERATLAAATLQGSLADIVGLG